MMDVAAATQVLREESAGVTVVLTMSPIAFWGAPRATDFRLVGTMGAAASIGLGLALGQPERPVWVLDGDGSLLMQLGVIAAVADAAPRNLVHVVFDNGIYAVSGAQPTPAPRDWGALLREVGYADAVTCETPDEVRAAIGREADCPRAVVVRCERVRPDYPAGAFAVVPRDEVARLRAAHGG